MGTLSAESGINPENETPADKPLLGDRRVSLGVGAVGGALSTLAITLSLRELLQDNPFFALAVFALLAATLIFVVGLAGSASRLKPAGVFALALLVAGILAGRVAMNDGPHRVDLNIRATPAINSPKLVRFGKYEIGWGDPTATEVLAGGELTLDLSGVQSYYNDRIEAFKEGYKESERRHNRNCLAALMDEELAEEKIGPGEPRQL